MRKILSYVIFMILISGCVGIPKVKEQPVKTIANTNLMKNQNILFTTEKWWENSKDNNLKKIIELVLENNSQVKIAKLNIEKAEGYYGGTKRANLSMAALNLTYEKDYLKGTETITPLDIGEIRNSGTLDEGSVGATIGYGVDFWGKFEAMKKEASYSLLATKLEKKWINISISTLASEMYASYILVTKEINLMEEKKKIVNEVTNLSKKSHEIGIGTKEAHLTNLNNLNLINENINELKTQKTILLNGLNTLAGTINSQEIKEILTRVDKEQKGFKKLINVPNKINSDIIVNRPDVKYYLALIDSKREVLNSARADFYPRFTILGKYQYLNIDVENLLKGNSNLLGLGASLYLPLFNRTQLKQKVKIAGTDLNIFIENYNDNLIKAYGEVNNSLVSLKTSRKNNFIGMKTLENSKDIYIENDKLYKIGSISKLEYLISQSEYINAKINYLRNNYTFYNDQIKLIKTLGGYYKEEVSSNEER